MGMLIFFTGILKLHQINNSPQATDCIRSSNDDSKDDRAGADQRLLSISGRFLNTVSMASATGRMARSLQQAT